MLGCIGNMKKLQDLSICKIKNKKKDLQTITTIKHHNMQLFRLASVLVLSFLLSSCMPVLKEDITEADLEDVVYRFSQLRLEYVLSKEQVPPNKELLKLVVREKQLNLFKTLDLFKEKKPKIFSSLFAE